MGYRTKSVLQEQKTGVLVGASETDTVVSKEFPITALGAINLRVAVFYGETTITNGVSAQIETSDGYNLWTDVTASGGTISANAKVDVDSVAAATDIFTETAHGFTEGQAVVVSNNDDFDPLRIYFVLYLTANTFSLSLQQGGPVVNITANDVNIAVTALKVANFLISSDDNDEIPLGVKARVVVTSGVGDNTDIMDVKVTQGI